MRNVKAYVSAQEGQDYNQKKYRIFNARTFETGEEKHRLQSGQAFTHVPAPKGYFSDRPVCIVGDRIVTEQAYLASPGEDTPIDARNQYIIPGLTDLHFHGCMGADCCDGSTSAIQTLAEYELSCGVTQILPATMTMPPDILKQIAACAASYDSQEGADFLGLYMEGPFINPSRKGAQNEAFIRLPDSALLKELQRLSGHKFRICTIAPEMEGSIDFIRQNKKDIRISLAHMEADYETALQAYQAGASQLTHTFNAMPGMSHRRPGPIAAAADQSHVMAELICDGIHIHPAMVRTAFRLFGEERICFISDSMRACGLSDGTYDLGGQTVTVKGRTAALSDGTIAGSVTNLMDCLRISVRQMGIPLASAVRCAALNPVRALGLEADYGSLKPGKYANLVFLSEELDIIRICYRGKFIVDDKCIGNE